MHVPKDETPEQRERHIRDAMFKIIGALKDAGQIGMIHFVEPGMNVDDQDDAEYPGRCRLCGDVLKNKG